MKIKRVLIPAAPGIFTLYPAYQTLRVHPYELCYYNELVGGVRGAYALGMETTYWYDVVYGKFLEILNRDIPQGADFKFSPDTPEYLILLSRQGTFNEVYWNIYYKSIPLYCLKFEDIPLISIYRWRDIKLI